MGYRVKLYSLDEDGSWNDMGTGWAEIQNNIIVVVFDDDIPKFISKLTNNPDFYQLEGGFY
jgi:hypothetical protein